MTIQIPPVVVFKDFYQLHKDHPGAKDFAQVKAEQFNKARAIREVSKRYGVTLACAKRFVAYFVK